MAYFEKAALNALEVNFLAVISGCFFHFGQNIYRQIQIKGSVKSYLENEFAMQMKMFASLAFVQEK